MGCKHHYYPHSVGENQVLRWYRHIPKPMQLVTSWNSMILNSVHSIVTPQINAGSPEYRRLTHAMVGVAGSWWSSPGGLRTKSGLARKHRWNQSSSFPGYVVNLWLGPVEKRQVIALFGVSVSCLSGNRKSRSLYSHLIFQPHEVGSAIIIFILQMG